MQRLLLALIGAASIAASPLVAEAQTSGGKSGVNIGSLQCKVSGGMGFVFGSSKELDCLLVRVDGPSERYIGTINKYGVDIGFTKEAHIVWMVFAPGSIAPGALAGDYAGATAGAAVGAGVGANVLLGGSDKQVTLQPVSIEGSAGLNVAAGVASVSLKHVR